MRLKQPLKFLFLTAAFVLLSGGLAYGRCTADWFVRTLLHRRQRQRRPLGCGSNDPNWSVGFASINGGTSATPRTEGAAYVITAATSRVRVSCPNTSAAQWTHSARGKFGSDGGHAQYKRQLPSRKNGNTGSNEGIYVYTPRSSDYGYGD